MWLQRFPDHNDRLMRKDDNDDGCGLVVLDKGTVMDKSGNCSCFSLLTRRWIVSLANDFLFLKRLYLEIRILSYHRNLETSSVGIVLCMLIGFSIITLGTSGEDIRNCVR